MSLLLKLKFFSISTYIIREVFYSIGEFSSPLAFSAICLYIILLSFNTKELFGLSNSIFLEYDPSTNGCYVITGKLSNVFVIDLDNMDEPICKMIYEEGLKCCNYIVKTRKGYHLYFNMIVISQIHKLTKNSNLILDQMMV